MTETEAPVAPPAPGAEHAAPGHRHAGPKKAESGTAAKAKDVPTDMPPPTSFKPGDVVQLISGGARMTVTVDRGKEVSVVWLSDKGEPYGLQQSVNFPVVCLRKADGKK